MKRLAFAALLLAAGPALAQQPPVDPALMQALSGAIRQQRDAAEDQAAVAAAQLKVANDEIAKLKTATAKPLAPAPSPTPSASP